MDCGDRHQYYAVLGLDVNASASAIRNAYKKLAMKWHPDKCIFPDPAEAKRRFQEIQEAYAVLSDEKKKALYDNDLYDPSDDDEDIEGLSDFINEMSDMMADVRASEDGNNCNSFEELQQLFENMFGSDLAALSNGKTSFGDMQGWMDNQLDGSKFFYMDALMSPESKATERTRCSPIENPTASGPYVR